MIDFIFTQFSDAFIQDMQTALKGLLEEGYTLDRVVTEMDAAWTEYRNEQYQTMMDGQRLMREYYHKVRRCALCGTTMILSEVNHTKCTQVGGPWKSMWSCRSERTCGESVYSVLPIQEEAEKYGLGKFYLGKEDAQRRREAQMPTRRSRRAAMAAQQNKPVASQPCCGGK